MNWSQRRVLVTGIGGFIGRHLSRCLLAKGADVHGIDIREQIEIENLGHFWRIDLTNFDEVKKVIEEINPEIIYHLCSVPDGSRDLSLVLPTLHSEVVATVNMLTAANNKGIDKIIMSGSMEEPPTGEHPSSPYAAAKAASRLYAQMFHQLYAMPIVFTRIFMTYGPEQPQSKIIPYCILSLLNGDAPKIASPHRQVDWIYISDLVQGLISIGQAPLVEKAIWDLGSGTLVEIVEVVKIIKDLVNPGISIEFAGLSSRAFEQVRCADLRSTTAGIGWCPQVSLEQGLQFTIEYFRKKRQNGTDSEINRPATIRPLI